jgi:O-antigen ligase
MERLTRLLLIVSAALAIGLQTYLGARAHGDLVVLNLTACVGMWIVARIAPTAARWVVLGTAYAFPVLVLVTLHGWDDTFFSVWTSSLLGLILGTVGFAGWALPPTWRWPLALWGLAVAASWPVVVWRELDFTLSQLDRYTTAVTHLGIPPAAECAWVAHIAAIHLLGILWADALWRDGDPADPARVRQVPLPLLLGALGSALVGIYQMFGHIASLNPTVFAALHRSAGLMLDGNAFGMSAALWVAGAVALTATWTSPRAHAALALAALCLAVGAWASGSQSALLALAVGGLGAAYGAWRDRPSIRWRTGSVAATVGALILVGGVGAFAARHSSAIGPIARLREEFQADHSATKLDFLSTLWTRDRYGVVSTALVRQFPVTGVGIGLFNTLVIDESAILNIGTPTPDNAQNWFRQELAEMGLFGSLGWMLWLVTLVPTFWRQPPAGASRRAPYAIRGALLGLGLASLVGVPTMNPVVLITFWTFICWHARLVGPSVSAIDPVAATRAWPWALAIALAVVYAGCVHWESVTALRVPFRAVDVGWPYDHGFYDREVRPDGSAFRWTGERAVAVFETRQTPRRDCYLAVTFWVNHPDVATRPVHVKIWRRRTLIAEVTLSDSRPITRYVFCPYDQVAVMLELAVDRTWRPSERGASDARALGLGVADWVYTTKLPPGAVRIY